MPLEEVRDHRRGSINEKGWTINYSYQSEPGQEYLDYFASHRMTNDTLTRIHADGRSEQLGYCQEFFRADDEQAEQAYYAHNRAFYEDVKQRGLWGSVST